MQTASCGKIEEKKLLFDDATSNIRYELTMTGELLSPF